MSPDISKCPLVTGWGVEGEAKSLLVKNHLLIGIVWGTLCKFQCPLPVQPHFGMASGICILASTSVGSDAAASWTTQKHFSIFYLAVSNRDVTVLQLLKCMDDTVLVTVPIVEEGGGTGICLSTALKCLFHKLGQCA